MGQKRHRAGAVQDAGAFRWANRPSGQTGVLILHGAYRVGTYILLYQRFRICIFDRGLLNSFEFLRTLVKGV